MTALKTFLLVIVAFVTGSGHCVMAQAPSQVPRFVRTRFEELFRRVGAIRFEQSDSSPIVRISAIDVARDGRIALGDGSEGHVKVFSRSGRLLHVLGRKGRGPGEFQLPSDVCFDMSGRLFVADAQLVRVQVFDTSGTLLKIVSLQGLSYITGFALLSNGRFLVADQNDSALVHVFDSTGQAVTTYFPRDRSRAPVVQEPQSRLWHSLLFYNLAVRHDTAFVVSTLSDSVWTVSLADGTRSARSLAFPGYRSARLPSAPLARPGDLRQWRREFHTAALISAGQRGIGVAFARGILNFGDPSVLLFGELGRPWRVIDNSPVVLYFGDDEVLVLATPDMVDSVVVDRYVYR